MPIHAVVRLFRLGLFAVSITLASTAALAQADDIQEVTRLLRAGQLDQAAARADKFLEGKPKDAQMRFLKGVILTDQKKTPEAIAQFMQLSTDFPELPEPYNNLAVIYAAQGQYDKARAALEMAVRVAPSWGTAHENLGDVYLKLAAQAYEKAAQFEPHNGNVARKLAATRDLGASAAPAAKK